MNPIYQFSGDTREHRLLHELLPLASPLSILVDPTNLCNFACVFCPTGHAALVQKSGRGTGIMSLELFRKIAEDIGAFGAPLERLLLHKDGEPLLNKGLAQMVKLAKTSGISRSVETTTNAALLTPERSRELIDAGLDRLRISVEHVTDAGYRSIAGTSTTYQNVLQNTRDAYELRNRCNSSMRIYAKLLNTGLSKQDQGTFLKDFSGCCDEIHIDELMGWSVSSAFDFTLGTHPPVGMSGDWPLVDRIVCPQPFYTMAINFDGRVSVCCVDWTFSTIVGDVTTSSLQSIWNGAPMNQFRMMHLRSERNTHRACGDCHYVRGMSPKSDLDAHRDKLSQFYSKRQADDDITGEYQCVSE